MKKIIIFLALILAGNWAQAQEAKDLIDQDLTNAVFPAGVWAWQDGVLSPRDQDEVIWTKGYIGLQGAHGGIPTHYRNLKIKAVA